MCCVQGDMMFQKCFNRYGASFIRIGVLVLALPTLSAVQAQEWLRGTINGFQSDDWAGVYVGTFVGTQSVSGNQSGINSALKGAISTDSAVQAGIRNSISFADSKGTGALAGAFVGMNWQYEQLVYGVEAELVTTKASLNSSSPYTFTSTASNIRTDVNGNATAKATQSGWFAVRSRVGWALTDRFMPYMAFGVAMGSAEHSAQASGTWSRTDITNPAVPVTSASGTYSGHVVKNGWVFGPLIGAGMDIRVAPNAFLRGEVTYLRFGEKDALPKTSMTTARIGGAMKF